MTSVLTMVPLNILETLGLIPGQSERNVLRAIATPPYLPETAKHICGKLPNPQGLTPADLLRQRKARRFRSF